jgi:DNA-binding NarL/FixJ family response regulator
MSTTYERCTKCLRQTLRRPHMQIQLEKLARQDLVAAKIAIMAFEQGWSLQQIAKELDLSDKAIDLKECKIIEFLRGGCCRNDKS